VSEEALDEALARLAEVLPALEAQAQNTIEGET
jgi:hypothetical protein